MELLTQLYKICSKSGQEQAIKDFVIDSLQNLTLHFATDEIGNIYITKGQAHSYPCIAAHLDEIHFPCQRDIIVDNDMDTISLVCVNYCKKLTVLAYANFGAALLPLDGYGGGDFSECRQVTTNLV